VRDVSAFEDRKSARAEESGSLLDLGFEENQPSLTVRGFKYDR